MPTLNGRDATMTELALSEGLKQGDNNARKELYEHFAGSMLSLCRRYAGSHDEAEDLLHDGFLQVFEVIDKFTYRGEGSLAAWLRRVFTNFVLSWLDKQKKLEVEDVETLPDRSDEDEYSPPNISTDTILELIAELPPGYRTVLNLFLIEGWSHTEIATHLNIKESTSASQYLRAKKLLKEKITHYLNTHDL